MSDEKRLMGKPKNNVDQTSSVFLSLYACSGFNVLSGDGDTLPKKLCSCFTHFFLNFSVKSKNMIGCSNRHRVD